MISMPETELLSPTATSTRAYKVLHVGKFYPPHMGGIETHLQTLCGELSKSLQLHVIVASDDSRHSDEVVNGVAVSRLATRVSVASTPICPSMVTQIHGTDADIVHMHFPNPLAVMALLTSRYRGRVVVTYHSDTVRQKVLGPLFEPWLQAALRRSAAIITTSPNYQRTSAALARHLDRCNVIPYGIHVDHFAGANPHEVARLRGQFGNRVVISVGRLVYYKGFEHLIRAMAKVDGRLVIVGDGPLREKLRVLTNSLDLSGKIVFAGEIQNEAVIPYYHAADVFALASVARSEAFGIVQIEAMAAGLPVVNTGLDSGVPFVSLHEQTGLTVPPGDPDALAVALNRLLDDHGLRQKFGAGGRNRAMQEFSVTAMTRKTLALYDRVMHK